MYKKFLTMLLVTVMIGGGVVADQAAAIEQRETFVQTVEKCKKAYLNFKLTRNPELFNQYADAYDEESRKGFGVICLTYAMGYEDGINGRT